MSSEHAGRLVREPCAYAGRDADMPSLPSRADRYYSAQGTGRAGRSRRRRPSWRTRDNAGIARALAFIQRHAVDDHLSSRLPAAEPVALRETESLGRHDAGPRATRRTNQRKTAKLFSIICSGARRTSKDPIGGHRPPLQLVLIENRIHLLLRCEMNGQRQNHPAHFAAWNFDRVMQRTCVSFMQKDQRTHSDQRRQNCRCAHTPVPDRARILHPALQTILRFFHPSLVDRLETIGSGQNLRRTQTDLSKLILRKVTSTASQIAAGITQDIDQLKSHTVASATRKHFVRD